MSDTEVLDALRGAWETISSDGANKTAPGSFKGNGARANRGSESREIHFADGEQYLAHYTTMINASDSISRNRTEFLGMDGEVYVTSDTIQ
jgi:hypothetical protein